ncbi:MAG: cobalamin B12-binding domain-containing protein [bacterium JZ-2024 1]
MHKVIRVLLAKIGLDGHDRGIKVIARALRDSGMEVIYSGLHRTPEEIAEMAVQEDVDFLGVSILSGAHMVLIPRLLNQLKQKNAQDIVVLVGGTIPEDDAQELKKMGVAEVYFPGTLTTQIVEDIHRIFEQKTKG